MKSREIRFRAWDKQSKRMEDVDTLNLYMGCANESDMGSLWFDDIVLMQYTGLIDKNGKEIFEGDIVRVYDENRLVEFKHAFWTNLDIGGFGTMITQDEGNKYFKPLYRYGDAEVIGNIWENPELLEDKGA